MIAEFERIGGDLEREIKTEQDRAGIHDPGHFAYPVYASDHIRSHRNCPDKRPSTPIGDLKDVLSSKKQ
jgi:hypothetical protein